MELSLNEVETTIVKAVRGRGLDHGIATEVGAAARWLCEEGLDGISAVVEALSDDAACTADALGLGAVDLALASSKPITVEACSSSVLLTGLAGRVGITVSPEPAGFGLSHSIEESEHDVKTVTVSAPKCWKQIEQWAAQTYVPSSEQSRAAGAGAGLTDND